MLNFSCAKCVCVCVCECVCVTVCERFDAMRQKLTAGLIDIIIFICAKIDFSFLVINTKLDLLKCLFIISVIRVYLSTNIFM